MIQLIYHYHRRRRCRRYTLLPPSPKHSVVEISSSDNTPSIEMTMSTFDITRRVRGPSPSPSMKCGIYDFHDYSRKDGKEDKLPH
jgi:hypothetical protein